MKKQLSILNNEQLDAVKTTKGAVLVLSGAGTGKTLVLTSRIAYILSEKLAKSWEILALTFTNKAANEMKERLAAFGYSCDWLGTFHSVCLRILRRNAGAAGLRPDFLIYGEDEQKAVLKNIITSLGLDTKEYNPSEWVEKVSFYKDTFAASDKKMSDIFNQIYTAYNAEMERLSALDFGDIINKTIKLFDKNIEVRKKYQDQFKYVLVDEYQDTNAAQNLLLKKLNPKNICCVGDDDQSIYSWRGAEIKNILNFSRDYPGAKIIRMEQNYRSTGNILAAANSLIGKNVGRLGKNLRTELNGGEKVRVISCASGLDEANNIVRKILDSKLNYSDIAVLIRSGRISRTFEEEFARSGIPYTLVGTTRFYDRLEVRDVIAYLRLLCFPFDDLSFARIISKPKRKIGAATAFALSGYAKENNLYLFDALKDFKLSPKQRLAADGFANAFDFDWEKMTPVDATLALLDKSGYMKMWQESSDADKDDRLKNIRELTLNVISKFETLTGFIEQASLMTADDERDDENSVKIMTIHAAKGLEFDTVFLPAWEEGIFPNEMSLSDGGLEEERRLAYVAITRAKRNCFISHAFSRFQFGDRQYNSPSRFISEIGKLDLRGESNSKSGPDSRSEPDSKSKFNSKKEKNSKSEKDSTNRVGQVMRHDEFGMGVVIKQTSTHFEVAFKTGIKKIDVS